jgi:hypothetical protein
MQLVADAVLPGMVLSSSTILRFTSLTLFGLPDDGGVLIAKVCLAVQVTQVRRIPRSGSPRQDSS